MAGGLSNQDIQGTAGLRILYALTGLVVLAGVYFRFKGLGFSPFAIDEYYLATSVKSILEHGLPRFHGGGFYTRGIALQYMAAPLFLSGMQPEFAFRLVMVLFNLAALPAVFLIARHLAGNVAACLSLILFSLSVWEVEFARFARMYAPFSTLLVWHVYFSYRRIMLGDPRAIRWMWVISIAAIFISEYAVFLALLNFLPVLLRKAQRPVAEYLVPVLILAVTYKWGSINFRRLGVTDYLPAEMMSDTAGAAGRSLPVHMPTVMLPEVLGSVPWLLGFLLPLLAFLAAAGAWARWGLRREGELRDRLVAMLPIAVLGLALLNLFSLAAWAAILILLLAGVDRRDLPAMICTRLAALSALSIVVSLVFWCVYLASTSGWQARVPISTGVAWKDGILLLFNYPNMLREVIVPWQAAMPLQSVLMGALVVAGAWVASARVEPRFKGYLLVMAIMLGMFLLVPVFTKPYYTLRYTYFVYPLLLILSAVAIVYLVENFVRRPQVVVPVSVLLMVGLMFASEDFDARHLIEIDSERVTYRMGYKAGKIDQYYTRRDFRSPAEFVNANLGPNDVVISTEYSVPYYLERMNYLYMDQEGMRFTIIAGQRGTHDIWEGAKLVGTEDQLFQIILNTTGKVWVISKSDKSSWLSPGERRIHSRLANHMVFRSTDGYLDVYEIAPLHQAID